MGIKHYTINEKVSKTRALSSKEDFLDILYGVKSDGVKR